MSADNRDSKIRSSGMTPSIITTINNTSPTPPVNNNTNSCINTSKRKPSEPYYESYIEDSFVGHWEKEDDDIDDEFREGRVDNPNAVDDDESNLHPSTIEFDFDSFGPESFIYTPAAAKQPTNDKSSNNVEDQSKVVELRVDESEQVAKHEEKLNQDQIKSIRKSCERNLSPLDYSLVDEFQIDLKVIEPYKRVISHAGYCHHFDPTIPAPKPGEPAPAIIVFSACYLPDRYRRDYNYVMDHLFLYILSSLHELIADDYILIYLHNTSSTSSTTGSISSKGSSSNNLATSSSSSVMSDDSHQNNLPTFSWMKRCYQMIDRKLRKNLKILYLVKPTFWLKTIVIMCRPFISTKFSKKLRFVENMDALRKCLPVDQLILPASAENI